MKSYKVGAFVLWYNKKIMEHKEQKRLYRSDKNKVFAGICGGVGEYFDIDPSLVRLVWLLVVVFTGFVPGFLAYIIAMLVIPKRIT